MRVIKLQDGSFLIAESVIYVSKTKILNFGSDTTILFEIETRDSSYKVDFKIPSNSSNDFINLKFNIAEEIRINLKNFLISQDPLLLEYTINTYT
jgi:predicted nucleic acid-binding protein